MTHTLRPHQYEAVAGLLPALHSYGGCYLAHGVGSGKSLSAITLAKLLGARRVLVVVGPVAALGVWRLELQKWWPQATARVEHRHFVPELWDTVYHLPAPWVVVRNIDGLNQREMDYWLKFSPDLIVMDEAQFIAHPNTERYKKLARLRAGAQWFIAMSGTPVHNILGFWSQYRLIDPNHEMWGMSFSSYGKVVATWKGPHSTWFAGAKEGMIEHIAQIVAPYTHWFSTRDLQLPEPVYTEVPVELTPREQEAYEQMEKELLAEIATGKFAIARNPLSRIMRLHQISCGHATTDEILPDSTISQEQTWFPESAKFTALLEMLRERREQKVIIVCRFIAEIDRIRESLEKTGPPPGARRGDRTVRHIDGRVPSGEREQIVRQFQESQLPQVVIMQPRSGGISASMTAADAIIFYSLEPSSIVWAQTIGRAWRLGQTTHVQVLTLTATLTDRALYRGLRQGLEENDLAKHLIGEPDND